MNLHDVTNVIYYRFVSRRIYGQHSKEIPINQSRCGSPPTPKFYSSVFKKMLYFPVFLGVYICQNSSSNVNAIWKRYNRGKRGDVALSSPSKFCIPFLYEILYHLGGKPTYIRNSCRTLSKNARHSWHWWSRERCRERSETSYPYFGTRVRLWPTKGFEMLRR